MARVNIVLDDVLLILRNKQKVAKEKTKLVIPKHVSNNGKTRSVTLDVSSEGKRLLQETLTARDKAIATAEANYQKALVDAKADLDKQTVNAWKNLNKLVTTLQDGKKGSSDSSDEEKEVKQENTSHEAETASEGVAEHVENHESVHHEDNAAEVRHEPQLEVQHEQPVTEQYHSQYSAEPTPPPPAYGY